jgi:hypothetical protein
MPGEATAPLAHGLFGRLQIVSDFFVGSIQGSEEDDSSSKHLSLAGARRPRQCFQLLPLDLIQYDFRGGT